MTTTRSGTGIASQGGNFDRTSEARKASRRTMELHSGLPILAIVRERQTQWFRSVRSIFDGQRPPACSRGFRAREGTGRLFRRGDAGERLPARLDAELDYLKA